MATGHRRRRFGTLYWAVLTLVLVYPLIVSQWLPIPSSTLSSSSSSSSLVPHQIKDAFEKERSLEHQLLGFKEPRRSKPQQTVPTHKGLTPPYNELGITTTTTTTITVSNDTLRHQSQSAVVVGPETMGGGRRKLQEKLDAIYMETGMPYDGDLWELSDYVPQWMKEYFIWHRNERAKWNQETWESRPKVLVMQCLRGVDTKCGGTADRLKGFLFLLREAYKRQRLLLIHWTLPARLEEFLLPPIHGIDWRVPDWFSEILHHRASYPDRYLFNFKTLMDSRHDDPTILFRTRLQSITGGAEMYDKELLPGEPSFAEVYHDVWRIFFTPSSPVRFTVEAYLEKWNLTPGEYAAAHLRALYGRVTNRSDELATEWAQNALNCASNLRPGGPFLFASDHTFSTQAAMDYGQFKHVTVVSRNHLSPPLHLDNAEHILDREPSEFYDVFVDLYFMGMSRCLTYNRGGFGQWALLIGYNASCYHNQKTSAAGIGAPCLWTDDVHQQSSREKTASATPLFLAPITDQEIPKTENQTVLTPFSKQPLPVWMTDYFEWHRETRARLTHSNWNETKYLVLSCKKHDDHCGGVSDRLKTLPFAVLQAARHRRLLFIHWLRPNPLQSFLVPPEGGVDWQMPSFLRRFFRKLEPDTSYGVEDLNRKMYVRSNDVVIYARLQSAGAGEELYANQPDSHSTYQGVFHGLFRAFFVPAPRLQTTIDEKMTKYGLVPNQYVAVHLRNIYGNRVWRHPNETVSIVVNGINCASNLFPGAPIFFASDDIFAVDVAREYGRQRNIPVSSLDFRVDPLHIDKDDHWKNRSAADYDDTFLDLYMLGEARCVAYSNGGYGSFGSLLSYNSSCSVRYFRGRHMFRNCTYTDSLGQEILHEPPVMNIPPELYIDPRQQEKK